MMEPGDGRRRWFGLFFLGLAFGMLIWGQTVFKPHLEGIVFLLYWGVCFVFTALAVVVALWDLRVMRARTRRQQKELLERTLEEIQQAEDKKQGN